MTTATLTAPAVDSRPMADILNEALASQAAESPLNLLDRCDRCGAAAYSVFTYTLPGTEADVMLCGHHTRMHLPALLAKAPKEFWIDPAFLFKITGVNIPKPKDTRDGDGLTDA